MLETVGGGIPHTIFMSFVRTVAAKEEPTATPEAEKNACSPQLWIKIALSIIYPDRSFQLEKESSNVCGARHFSTGHLGEKGLGKMRVVLDDIFVGHPCGRANATADGDDAVWSDRRSVASPAGGRAHGCQHVPTHPCTGRR